MTKVTSVRLSDELAARLDQLAASVDRPKAWLIEQAIARYVEQEAWQVQAITEALTEYRQGKAATRPHSAVMEELGRRVRAALDDAGSLA